MILDTEEQRNVLLGVINTSTFVGQALDQLFWLKQAVLNATIILPTTTAVPVTENNLADIKKGE